MAKSRSYQEDLFRALQNPEEAKEYLNAALDDANPEIFLLALRDVVEANRNKSYSLSEANYEGEVVLKVLSEQGVPELTNIRRILGSLGYRLMIEKLLA